MSNVLAQFITKSTCQWRQPYIFMRAVRKKHDMIGPPDPVSNLRPVQFMNKNTSCPLEREYNNKREEVHKWNEGFWTKHNTEFVKAKEKFTKTKLAAKGTDENLNADEMSHFYKEFLDLNWQRHLNYNFTWYKKNISLLVLEFRVKINQLIKK